MKTISKVKNVQGNGSFENQYGAEQPDGKKLLFKFEYEMEDGTCLMANHKQNTPPFPIGTEVEYEVTREHPDYGKSGKVSKPSEYNGNSRNGDNVKGQKIGHAITAGVYLHNANGHHMRSPQNASIIESIEQYAIDIYKLGEKLNNEL